jgi:hypothetical protein
MRLMVAIIHGATDAWSGWQRAQVMAPSDQALRTMMITRLRVSAMIEPLAAQGAYVRPTVEVAVTALRRIAGSWELDRYDAVSLVAAGAGDFSAVEWSEDCLTRLGYLIDLDKALHELNPKFGIARWIKTPNPGPFFAGSSPLQVMTGSTRSMLELLHQIRRWSRSTGRS